VVGAYADPKLEFIRKHTSLEGHILDIGCGNGVFTSRLAQSGDVIGLDFSRHLLSQNPHKFLTCGDAAALPFREGSFDLVFEGNILHHVSNRTAVVREMCRVTRMHIALVEPNRYNPLMFGLSVVVPAERGGLKSSLRRLSREVEQAGMRVLASCTTGLISQNNTPQLLVPMLKRFDRPIWWGEYIVIVAEKVN
jgi:ubiquinone/menaquinone biosynthesis C-methylase UbiE